MKLLGGAILVRIVIFGVFTAIYSLLENLVVVLVLNDIGEIFLWEY